MSYPLMRQKVADYDIWKCVFDEQGAARQAGGSKGGGIFRSADDPNEVVVLLEWDAAERAREFANAKDLRRAMAGAGATDEPSVWGPEQADDPVV